jgi:hypothetical protein
VAAARREARLNGFDQFVTDALNDYEKFSINKREEDAKN